VNLSTCFTGKVSAARWQGESTKAQAAFNAARNEGWAKTVEEQPKLCRSSQPVGYDRPRGLGAERRSTPRGVVGRVRNSCPSQRTPSTAVGPRRLFWRKSMPGLARKDLAIEQIAGGGSASPKLSELRLFSSLSPIWDSLHGDPPPFEKIVASLAPKG